MIAESGVGFHTSDTIMGIDELPASMVIVGGGYVAAEFAHIFSGLGVAVRLVEMAPRAARHVRHSDISERFTALAAAATGTSICRPRSPGSGGMATTAPGWPWNSRTARR